jgi:diaminopimelate epimerase
MSAVAPGLPVVKMHGAHNSFIVLDERAGGERDYPALARRWCAREGGLEADGLLVIAPAPDAAALATMRVFNADGSEAEMCGNGIRCVARFLHERGAPERFALATAAGPIGVEIVSHEPEYAVRADLGIPSLAGDGGSRELSADGRSWRYREVSLGNPHAVVALEDFGGLDVARSGAAISTHPNFPRGVNVHFVRRIDDRTLEVRHFERGVGVTQACGTGAVAAAVAGIARGELGSPVTVWVPGGRLEVGWVPGGHASLSGPAETLYEGFLTP